MKNRCFPAAAKFNLCREIIDRMFESHTAFLALKSS
jgi:hypothetical protein